MFSAIGRSQIGVGPWVQRIVRGRSGRFARLFGLAWLAALVLLAVAGSVAAYAATPTVTGVSPDTGPPAGGTPVTIRGTGFAVGKSATHFTFGYEAEAAAVECTTTTECTATSPEMSTEDFGIVDVTATVENVASSPTVEDQFEYYGLYLLGDEGRLRVGDELYAARGEVSARETSTCVAGVGAEVLSNGEVTDELKVQTEHFFSCDTQQFFGDLPFSFGLRLGADGSATIEGPMGVRTRSACIYEGDRLGGSVEPGGGLSIHLGGTFTLVEEEEPGAECPATESVSMTLFAERDFGEYIGAARPTVTGLSPGGGPEAGGTSVTITGAGLGEASAVKFGSADAASFTVTSPSSITAVSPPGEGTVAVTVTSPRGAGTAGGTGDEFTYGPAVSGVEPDHGPRAGGTSVTITGVNLDEASAVTFGATPAASFTVLSPTSVTAVAPAGTGMVDVTVNTPEGTSPTGAQDRFSYDVPPPTITEISPATGPEAGGTAIIVSGTDFTGATGVKFGATNATSFTVNSDTSLTAVSPGGTGTVHVSVTTPNGTSTNDAPDRFTYQPPAAPEFGRCLKQATKSLSNFDSAKCTKTASEDAGTEAEKLKKGNYQWFPGVVNNKFTTKMTAATIATIESVGGMKISCTGETSGGEYVTGGTNKDVGGVVIQFSGCETHLGKCNSPGKGEGKITTAALEGALGVEKVGTKTPLNDTVALDLHAPAGEDVAKISCGSLPVVIRGSVLHKVAANAMKLTATEKFTAAKGKQKPEHFAGGVPGEHILEMNSGNGFEQTGLTMAETVTNEEKVEASTVN
jgi:IPT/TIG domain